MKLKEENMKVIYVNDTLTFLFYGEMDNLAIMRIKENAIACIEQYRASKVKIDFKDVTFVDSTGIGFILARYNQVRAYGGELSVKNCSPSIHRLFALSGIFQIIKLEKDAKKEVVL